MSIQLTGTVPIDFTFSSGGTRIELVSQFQTQLTAAGWTVISGGGSSDVIMESATTPQGVKIQVEAIDAGGNCAQFKVRDGAALIGLTTMFLLPVNGSPFRIWANKYQFFYFLSGTNMGAQRSFVCGGVPWVPFFIQDTFTTSYAGWLHGNGASDTDTHDLNSCFRKVFTANAIRNYSAIWNGVAFGVNNTFNKFGLIVQTALTLFDDMWEEGTFTLFEPILVWESALGTVRHGQLWDAALTSKPLDSELRRTFGGITWRNVTHQNTSTAGGRGCLMLLTPPV
jgi:hypothetical protein